MSELDNMSLADADAVTRAIEQFEDARAAAKP